MTTTTIAMNKHINSILDVDGLVCVYDSDPSSAHYKINHNKLQLTFTTKHDDWHFCFEHSVILPTMLDYDFDTKPSQTSRLLKLPQTLRDLQFVDEVKPSTNRRHVWIRTWIMTAVYKAFARDRQADVNVPSLPFPEQNGYKLNCQELTLLPQYIIPDTILTPVNATKYKIITTGPPIVACNDFRLTENIVEVITTLKTINETTGVSTVKNIDEFSHPIYAGIYSVNGTTVVFNKSDELIQEQFKYGAHLAMLYKISPIQSKCKINMAKCIETFVFHPQLNIWVNIKKPGVKDSLLQEYQPIDRAGVWGSALCSCKEYSTHLKFPRLGNDIFINNWMVPVDRTVFIPTFEVFIIPKILPFKTVKLTNVVANCMLKTLELKPKEFTYPKDANQLLQAFMYCDKIKQLQINSDERYIADALYEIIHVLGYNPKHLTMLSRIVYQIYTQQQSATALILIGPSGGGKSTLTGWIQAAVNPSVMCVTDITAINPTSQNTLTIDIANSGLCVLSEVSKLDSQVFKVLTGGDVMSLRPMYGETYSNFKFTTPFLGCSNRLPIFHDLDHAIFRRVWLATLPYGKLYMKEATKWDEVVHTGLQHKTIDVNIQDMITALYFIGSTSSNDIVMSNELLQKLAIRSSIVYKVLYLMGLQCVGRNSEAPIPAKDIYADIEALQLSTPSEKIIEEFKNQFHVFLDNNDNYCCFIRIDSGDNNMDKYSE